MLINNTLAKYLNIYIIIYLNNIFIYLRNLENYQRYIKNILERLLIKQLRYKLEKYKFYKIKVDFLGFIVRIDRSKINPEKIQKILDWPEPRNLKNF